MDNRHPYLTKDITEAVEKILAAGISAVTAGIEDNPERAYERLMDTMHELHNCEHALFAALHLECPECGDKSAQYQPSDCPCCGTLNSAIPRHLISKIDEIWNVEGSVVTCPVCDGECDVTVDGVADHCPACGGGGAMHKEDALIIIREMHYEAQGLLTDEEDESEES